MTWNETAIELPDSGKRVLVWQPLINMWRPGVYFKNGDYWLVDDRYHVNGNATIEQEAVTRWLEIPEVQD